MMYSFKYLSFSKSRCSAWFITESNRNNILNQWWIYKECFYKMTQELEINILETNILEINPGDKEEKETLWNCILLIKKSSRSQRNKAFLRLFFTRLWERMVFRPHTEVHRTYSRFFTQRSFQWDSRDHLGCHTKDYTEVSCSQNKPSVWNTMSHFYLASSFTLYFCIYIGMQNH